MLALGLILSEINSNKKKSEVEEDCDAVSKGKLLFVF